MDQELVGWLNEIGHGSRAVYFYDLFPDIPLHDPKHKLKKYLFATARPKLWRALVDSGRDFIHSDGDAFWLKDPCPWLAQHTEFDLLISQGTVFPRSHFLRYHFVLYAGFFFCRANVRTQNYFRQVEEAQKVDQNAMNELLLHDPKTTWQIRQSQVLQHTADGYSMCRHNISTPRKKSDNWIYISPDIIRRRFSNGFTVGVIPMHLVTRVSGMSSTTLLVSHIPQNKK